MEEYFQNQKVKFTQYHPIYETNNKNLNGNI